MNQTSKIKSLQQQIDGLIDELAFYKDSFGRTSLALETIKDGVWDYNLIKGEVYFSPQYYLMLGYKPYELPQSRQTWINLLHPDDREKTVSHIDKCIEIDNDWSIEFRLRTKDGGYKWILGRGNVVARDKDGCPLRRIGTHTDITEKKQLEVEREELIEKLNVSLQTVNTLSGMIPICSSCKNIRDDKGFWNRIEEYIQSHSTALFTHSICPECAEKIYGDDDWYKEL